MIKALKKIKEELEELKQKDYEYFCHCGYSLFSEDTWDEIIEKVDKIATEHEFINWIENKINSCYVGDGFQNGMVVAYENCLKKFKEVFLDE